MSATYLPGAWRTRLSSRTGWPVSATYLPDAWRTSLELVGLCLLPTYQAPGVPGSVLELVGLCLLPTCQAPGVPGSVLELVGLCRVTVPQEPQSRVPSPVSPWVFPPDQVTPVKVNSGALLPTLPGSWCNKVSAQTRWPAVSIL